MSNPFATQKDIAAPADIVGGGSRTLETGVYDMAIDMAYLDMSKGGAYALNLVLKSMDGSTLRQQLWLTGGTTKGQLNYYTDKEGKKQYLPGFNIANALSVLTAGKELGELTPEDKMVSIYNFDLKKEVPTSKPVYTDLIGQLIKVAVNKQTVNKNKKNEVTGAYEATAETRTENEIAHVFSATTGQSMNEFTGGKDADFLEKWAAANSGKTRDRTKKAEGTAGAAAKPVSSLFAK